MSLNKKKKITLHPIMCFIVLIIITIILSAILGALGLSTNYNIINPLRGDFESTTVAVTSLLSLSSIKQIFRTTVSNFVGFAPLSSLLIILIGIGIMDKSGFLQAFFTSVTKNAKKNTVTFVLSLIAILASIIGDISFVVLIPIYALFFKYSKRNPKAGIIMAFAGLTCGTGINIFMNSIDSALRGFTLLASNSLDSKYTIGNFSNLFIMILLTIVMTCIISSITERIIIPKLKRSDEEELEEEFYLDKRKKRGLLFSTIVGFIYIMIFTYNIIPGLPFSGNLLDYSQKLYIDKLFGFNSFFNQGFVIVITLFFFLCGLSYGLGAKTIKNNRDVSEFLSQSLDGIGKTLVLIFFASVLISIFKESNIGTVITALIAKFLSSINFSGIPLILISFILMCLVNLLIPSPVAAWAILSGVVVPIFMNAGMTPEFSELVFRGSQCVTFGLTPLMAYYVIYLSYMNVYSDKNEQVSLFSTYKPILPYVGFTALVWITILIVSYVIGIPIGIGTTPIL